MKKDFIRDYTAEAFRLYALNGEKTAEELKKRIYEDSLRENTLKNPQTAILKAEEAVKNAIPLLSDIEAVHKTLQALEKAGKDRAVKAIKAVYFTMPSKKIARGDISNRVRRFAVTNYCTERGVYSDLREARKLLAYFRGLRVE